MKNKKNYNISIGKELLKFIRTSCIFIGIIILVKIFLVEFDLAPKNAMNPTIKENDLLLVNKWKVHLKSVGDGIGINDIVIINRANDDNKSEPMKIVKKTIGLPGDKIEIKNGEIFRNGIKTKYNFLKNKVSETNLQPKNYLLKEDEIFVIGDNMLGNTDSRDYGPIQVNTVSGIVFESFSLNWLFGTFH
ncbi:signal peptidase I [Bacillus toyonensis]|uniref:signal peptidase I n=1 Tax=Bacillus toyonensis TaxID=155322 RepID=UPI002E1B0475|nr:signal peptidase I [Bacillus toyonensis]MED2737391.1 signal peptidase I [Bacillus toyonensis]